MFNKHIKTKLSCYINVSPRGFNKHNLYSQNLDSTKFERKRHLMYSISIDKIFQESFHNNINVLVYKFDVLFTIISLIYYTSR